MVDNSRIPGDLYNLCTQARVARCWEDKEEQQHFTR